MKRHFINTRSKTSSGLKNLQESRLEAVYGERS